MIQYLRRQANTWMRMRCWHLYVALVGFYAFGAVVGIALWTILT